MGKYLHCPTCGSYEGVEQKNENSFLCKNCETEFELEELLQSNLHSFDEANIKEAKNKIEETRKKMKWSKI